MPAAPNAPLRRPAPLAARALAPLILAPLVLAPLVLAPLAGATAYRAVLTAAQLDQQSTATVRGVVVSLRPEAVGDGLIQTIVTIDVDESYRGRVGEQVEVVAPGGELEGRRLHIAGAPTFALGEEVLVFTRGRTLVGFGQGAFGVEGQIAARTLGNEVEGAPITLDLRQAFGRPDEAEICQHNRLDADYNEGWSLRGADTTRVAPGEDATYALTLVKGHEYRLQVCADGGAAALGLHLVDEDGVVLSKADGRGRELELRFSPAETGAYYVVLDVSEPAPGVLRSAAALSVEFR
ncbi:MAG: hypothetical protein RL071_1999 [Pseudomonadota bacterium]|jgi:hypothetical protein